MDKLQTSIEWLYKLSKERELDKFDLEQAKEMHKQEIMDFVYKAVRKILDEERTNPFNLEQYYQETFK
jgi:hypothetical protein